MGISNLSKLSMVIIMAILKYIAQIKIMQIKIEKVEILLKRQNVGIIVIILINKEKL